jgi:hypothetical protein
MRFVKGQLHDMNIAMTFYVCLKIVANGRIYSSQICAKVKIMLEHIASR